MSDVIFIDFRRSRTNIDLFEKPLIKVGVKSFVNKIIAVKMHFGEKGNTAYIKPAFINWFCNYLEQIGAKPFLTDTNTLYKGNRSNSYDHLKNAFYNGFSMYPIIIADGLRGESFVEIKGEGSILKNLYIASDIYYAEGILCASHFKGHEITGFGGAIKNIGMGCAARRGKLVMHSNISPAVSKKCIGCMECMKWCNVQAIRKDDKKAFIDPKKCIGCALCIDICKQGAIKINWNAESSDMQKRMVEYALGVHKSKQMIYVNFITDVSPLCDCYPFNGNPLVKDIGVLFSNDPVAIDQASYDLVADEAGKDVFKETHKEIDSSVQLKYGEESGLGSRKYKLIEMSG